MPGNPATLVSGPLVTARAPCRAGFCCKGATPTQFGPLLHGLPAVSCRPVWQQEDTHPRRWWLGDPAASA